MDNFTIYLDLTRRTLLDKLTVAQSRDSPPFTEPDGS